MQPRRVCTRAEKPFLSSGAPAQYLALASASAFLRPQHADVSPGGQRSPLRGRLMPVSSWFWQSGPGPEAVPVGPGRGQKHRRGLCAPGKRGLLQGLHPGRGPAALDTGGARQRQR